MEECCKKDVEEEIEKELEKECCCKNNNKNYACKSGNSCIYGLGVIGAAIFFFAKVTTFFESHVEIPFLLFFKKYKFIFL